jgi:hypothetical protein
MPALRSALIQTLRRLRLYHPLHDWRRDRRFHREGRAAIRRWEAAGRPPPPPDLRKYERIRQCARRYGTDILVETGTWFGNALFTLRRDFRELHSIELAPELHRQAQAALAHLRHIHLHLGDSATELPKLAATLSAPTLYWLDGHFCSGPSARGAKDTPIFEELDHLLRRPAGRNVILIDDARLFTGQDGYPTIDQLRQLAARWRPEAIFQVEDDIILIAPV